MVWPLPKLPKRLIGNCFQTVHQNGYDQDPYAKEFGINISDKLTSIEARVLPAPWVRSMLFSNLLLPAIMCLFLACLFCVKLKYHDTGKESECLPRVGQWDMKNKVNIHSAEVITSQL